ncbi:MAG: aconitate hydratase [Desulfatibacillaceae bacterium]|nr:aconitate hydratase [Desulfatibacillaceae bacterium]
MRRGKTLFEKILAAHGVDPCPEPGQPLSIPIDQTLTQDATGTMAYLEFEALGLDRVRTQLSVSYVDHNTLQAGFANFDDHIFLRTVAARYGVVFSAPGNGIAHQVHLERFGAPGLTLLGSDSHTCTGGGLGMVAIGAGGLDVAMAMAGEPFTVPMPDIVGVRLTGKLPPWAAAKDVILELLRRETVKGGVGRVFEYTGPGVKTLSVPQRATITNMGAELGATTSLFPSDENTLAFLTAQGRQALYRPLDADPDTTYARNIEIDLSGIEPMAACPHMPDEVRPVSELAGLKVSQVIIGSCTNSSFADLATVAAMLDGRKVHPEISLVIAPGSRQVLSMLAGAGYLEKLIHAGARILECVCGPCIGAGQAPPSAGITVRTFNRNFKGRSGTADAGIYLTSPETAAACAVFGCFADPRQLGKPPAISIPETFPVVDEAIIHPPEDSFSVKVVRGPNIKPLPKASPVGEELSGPVLIALGDNVTTDDILPAGTHILQYRSNIPAIAQYLFSQLDPDFAKRAQKAGQGFVVAGENYGQGSSREHAAIAPMYFGVHAVLALSFARIHRANLINFGIVPLILADRKQLEGILQGDILVLEGAGEKIYNQQSFVIKNKSRGNSDITVALDLNDKERQIVTAGGKLNWYRQNRA